MYIIDCKYMYDSIYNVHIDIDKGTYIDIFVCVCVTVKDIIQHNSEHRLILIFSFVSLVSLFP